MQQNAVSVFKGLVSVFPFVLGIPYNTVLLIPGVVFQRDEKFLPLTFNARSLRVIRARLIVDRSIRKKKNLN